MYNRRPADNEFAPFFSGYVALVPETDILAVLENQVDEIKRLAATVPSVRETFRYAEGKWSVREVMGHLTDGERVFGYRAFCISRGEAAPLPSFDENAYISESGYHAQPLSVLAEEFLSVRHANLAFLRKLDSQAIGRKGTASGKQISVLGLAFIMAGHVRHHFAILRDRYGIG